MKKIKYYYTERVAGGSDLYWQVGKTIGGQPVGRDHLDIITQRIESALCLDKNDVVLDIGCGNGLVTHEIASKVAKVYGVESNVSLFQSALANSTSDNVNYVNSNFFDFNFNDIAFNKLYMYEFIQHIEYHDLQEFMKIISSRFVREKKIFIGGVPDEEKKWDFYNTKKRRCELLQSLMTSNDVIGTWFHRDYLIGLGEMYGFRVKIIPQNEMLYTSHYRFDCLFELE